MAKPRIRRRPARQRMIEAGRRKIDTVRMHGIFVLPNLFTTASLFCAMLAIVQSMDQHFGFAALMILLSMVFDGMDGRVARLTHTQSQFGEQFDSIADMTAFGVAPALVMYKFCLFELGSLGWAAAFVFTLCAGVRLARFNCNIGVVDKRFFQGLPSPAAAALLAGFVWLVVDNKMPQIVLDHLPELAFVLTLYSGLTMVCNAPFFSGKSKVSLKNVPFWGMVVAAVVFIVVSSNPSLAIFILFCLYAVSGYVYQLYLFIVDKPNPLMAGPKAPLPEPMSATLEKKAAGARGAQAASQDADAAAEAPADKAAASDEKSAQ